MPQELPYLPTYKNVGLLFEKIRTAKVPESFTQSFLAETLGLKSSGDRSLIALLKALGFVDSSGRPTARYATLKNEKIAGIEVARGVREGYEALFNANENAHKLEGQELKGLVAQVAGSDTGTTSKIVGTFRALLGVADFDSAEQLKEEIPATISETEQKAGIEEKAAAAALSSVGTMRPDFHYNIQIHLPANGSEETYINIFNAVRKVFK